MHLREAGQAVAGGVLGADQLIPLLEPLIVQARPLHGWTLLARMQALGEQELFDKPDLASAVDGWESACVGVESQALRLWRRAACEQAFWRALAVDPPPGCLHFALADEKQADTLPQVFAHFLDILSEREEEIWANVPSANAYLFLLDAAVDELAPPHARSSRASKRS